MKGYNQTIIDYYDLNPIITETNKLKLTTTSNNIKLLMLTQDRTENKLKGITHHHEKIMRFSEWLRFNLAVKGHLDVSDRGH